MKDAVEREAESWKLHEELERAKLEVELKWQTLEAYEAEKRRNRVVEVMIGLQFQFISTSCFLNGTNHGNVNANVIYMRRRNSPYVMTTIQRRRYRFVEYLTSAMLYSIMPIGFPTSIITHMDESLLANVLLW